MSTASAASIETELEHLKERKNIVILGGGFGGAALIAGLHRALRGNDHYRLVLVDEKDYHLYYPSLYEVATVEEELSDLQAEKASATLPFAKILPKDVLFVKGAVKSIDQAAKTVTVNGDVIPFAYCVAAFGSETAYYGIPGMRENAITMKSLPDALKYRNAIELLVQSRSDDIAKKQIRLVIGGGGFTGVELASESVNLLGQLAVKYQYDIDKFSITVIDGAPSILFGQSEDVIARIVHRMKHLEIPIEILTSAGIKSVDAAAVSLSTGAVIPYDLFVWTGGVKAIMPPFAQPPALDPKGRLQIDREMRLIGSDCIFAIGDNAAVMDSAKRALPQTATNAIAAADYLAKALPQIIAGKTPAPFAGKPQPFIIPVCGKWGVARFPSGLTFYGWIPWFMHQYAAFRYFCRYMSWPKALRLARSGTKLYSMNDM